MSNRAKTLVEIFGHPIRCSQETAELVSQLDGTDGPYFLCPEVQRDMRALVRRGVELPPSGSLRNTAGLIGECCEDLFQSAKRKDWSLVAAAQKRLAAHARLLILLAEGREQDIHDTHYTPIPGTGISARTK